MNLYRKKPVVIEARQWDGSPTQGEEIISWMGGYAVGDPLWAAKPPAIAINTLEGWMRATAGDWIIKGVEGEFYPCKPDIFEKTYEAVME